MLTGKWRAFTSVGCSLSGVDGLGIVANQQEDARHGRWIAQYFMLQRRLGEQSYVISELSTDEADSSQWR